MLDLAAVDFDVMLNSRARAGHSSVDWPLLSALPEPSTLTGWSLPLGATAVS